MLTSRHSLRWSIRFGSCQNRKITLSFPKTMDICSNLYPLCTPHSSGYCRWTRSGRRFTGREEVTSRVSFLFCDFEDDGYLVKPTSSVDNPSLFWVLPLDFVWTQVYWSRRGSVAGVFHGMGYEKIYGSLFESQKQLDTQFAHSVRRLGSVNWLMAIHFHVRPLLDSCGRCWTG